MHAFDKKIFEAFSKYGHKMHRLSLGCIFIWFGLLKPFGEKTTTSLLAHTVYFFPPEIVLPFLGWWEVAIGICLIYKPLVKVSIMLQFIRIPGTILAFFMHPDICFVQLPLVPSPVGQYLIKDIVILFAGIAIAGTIYNEKSSDPYFFNK
ncbi:MAG: hypothetical protein KJ900_00530 [Proteobacteria bacterium]|jgi:uncharacterized membrane protein YkgB|nr:hypothetical protein [Desulfocapsa sp.]MBU3944836.1 hypothetical protein [Pseudomonadota bacterium]MCG2745685.1 hypothetical protein [Desulfobacteraceae bacterium]MBU3983952.1 hypothetical protein [Pseudomonadota bacterium]MBU4029435.1 hypothetical protein [Pseudomonadota bacterium]